MLEPSERLHDQPPHGLGQLSASELEARGRTDTMIARLWGAPSSTTRNPHGTSAAPVRLYSLEKMIAAKVSPDFSKATARATVASRCTAGRLRRSSPQPEGWASGCQQSRLRSCVRSPRSTPGEDDA